ncbi:hypothetical protein BpHYR1_011976 [Brachionus plicatilis]|uniref:Uncharacterized protein n=1 Tax=Brachionus plicatilis TaxID=10195 RepID=A0A3M7RZZ3_BRAPC|nr:hypothetical protein BpHYR1_011976 [Brachionus plicatilis]
MTLKFKEEVRKKNEIVYDKNYTKRYSGRNGLSKNTNKDNNRNLKYNAKKTFDPHRQKRNDVEARLLELQAKILLAKALAEMPVGYGRFDFDELGKRSVDSSYSNNLDKNQNQ